MHEQQAAVRVLAAYWEAWHITFPELHRRAQWHVVHHLSRQDQGGLPLGELVGRTRATLLLDESTVRDRVAEFAATGACIVEPPDAPLSARSLIHPSPDLLMRHDATLAATLAALNAGAPDLCPGVRLDIDASVTPGARVCAFECIAALNEGWSTLLDACFEAASLTIARRIDARRHLLTTSHRSLLLACIAHQYGLDATGPDQPILADRLAAMMLERTQQNFQTTRDHLAYLLTLRLLQRGPGRALSVKLAPAMIPVVHGALSHMAHTLTALLRRDGVPAGGACALRITEPAEAARLVPLQPFPFTIGRTEANTLRLPASDVSRTHCEITRPNHAIIITDLGSTNGTIVDGERISTPVTLNAGATIRIGRFEMVFEAPQDISDETIRMPRGPAGGAAPRTKVENR